MEENNNKNLTTLSGAMTTNDSEYVRLVSLADG